MDRRASVRRIVALSIGLATSAPALACVADVFTLNRLAEESAHAVAATVSEVRSYWTPDHSTIETEVTLSQVTRVTPDGVAAAPDIRFTMVGGTVGDTTLRICCVPEMHAGERWVMFLQSEYRLSPVLGMERGMFRIQTIDGVDRLSTPDGGAVLSIEQATGRIEVAAPVAPGTGAAEAAPTPRSTRGGITAVRSAQRTEAALAEPTPQSVTADAFLAAVRRCMPASRTADPGPVAPTRIRPAMLPVRPKSVEEVSGAAEAAP
jgi:hypothetical protein